MNKKIDKKIGIEKEKNEIKKFLKVTSILQEIIGGEITNTNNKIELLYKRITVLNIPKVCRSFKIKEEKKKEIYKILFGIYTDMKKIEKILLD